MMFDKFIYLKFSKKYVAELLKNLTLKERLDYIKWNFSHGIEKTSLILVDATTFKVKRAPLNNKEFFNYKIESEHLQLKGIDLQAETMTINQKFQQIFFK